VRAQRQLSLRQGDANCPGAAAGAGGVLGRRDEEADRLGLRPNERAQGDGLREDVLAGRRGELRDGGVGAVLGRGERALDFHLLAGPKGLTVQLGHRRGWRGRLPWRLACNRCTGPRHECEVADGQDRHAPPASPNQWPLHRPFLIDRRHGADVGNGSHCTLGHVECQSRRGEAGGGSLRSALTAPFSVGPSHGLVAGVVGATSLYDWPRSGM
jgi:hypothetical protein